MLRPLLEDKLWVKQYFIHRKYIHLSTIHNVQDLTVSKVLIYKPSPDKLWTERQVEVSEVNIVDGIIPGFEKK